MLGSSAQLIFRWTLEIAIRDRRRQGARAPSTANSGGRLAILGRCATAISSAPAAQEVGRSTAAQPQANGVPGRQRMDLEVLPLRLTGGSISGQVMNRT